MLNSNSNISRLLVSDHTVFRVLKIIQFCWRLACRINPFPVLCQQLHAVAWWVELSILNRGGVKPHTGWWLRVPKWPHLWGCIKQLRLGQNFPVKPLSHLVRSILTNGNDIWDQSSPLPPHKYMWAQKMGMESRQQGMEENKTIYGFYLLLLPLIWEVCCAQVRHS